MEPLQMIWIVRTHVTKSDHDPMLVAFIWHTSMPRPDIADYDIAFLTLRLDQWSYLTPCLSGLVCNRRDWPANLRIGIRLSILLISHMQLIVLGCMCMASKPKFRYPIGDREVAQRYIGDEVIRKLRVWVRIVLVNRLAHATGICKSVVRHYPVEDRFVTKVGVCYL